MTRITGDLRIEGLDEVQLSGLQNLVTVDGALTIHSNTLADLSPFVCLEAIGGRLEIGTAANLTDVTGMSALRSAQKLFFQNTGAAAVPTFSPGFTGPGVIEIENNPALVDLDGMSAWKPSDGGVYVLVRKNDRLESVTGLSGLLTGGPTPASVWLERLPALPSLAGLEGITELGYVDLAYLPLVADLTPLAQLEKAERLSLAGLPLVQDLQGLSSLTTAGELAIGGCWDCAPGLDSLTSLAGLSSLTAVDKLDVQGNEQLLSLAGAEQLTAIAGGWSVEENPFLTVDAIDAFAAQVGQDPCDPFSDPMCACYEPDEPEPDDEEI